MIKNIAAIFIIICGSTWLLENVYSHFSQEHISKLKAQSALAEQKYIEKIALENDQRLDYKINHLSSFDESEKLVEQIYDQLSVYDARRDLVDFKLDEAWVPDRALLEDEQNFLKNRIGILSDFAKRASNSGTAFLKKDEDDEKVSQQKRDEEIAALDAEAKKSSEADEQARKAADEERGKEAIPDAEQQGAMQARQAQNETPAPTPYQAPTPTPSPHPGRLQGTSLGTPAGY